MNLSSELVLLWRPPTRLIAATLAASGLVAIASAPLQAQVPDRSRPPAVGPAPALVLPAIHKRQLSNGLRVWVVESHEVPVVQINLVVGGGAGSSDEAGAGGDPVGKFGLAGMTAAMLTEGAGTRTALELADAIDFLGADISASSSWDNTSVRLHAPVARLTEALSLMADVALRPTFPVAELDRLRQQRLTSLTQARDDASTVAALAFARVVYGRHRYGSGSMGTAASLRSLTVDDLRAFHAARFVPAQALLIAVGDVQPDQVMSMLEPAFGAWKAAGASAARPAAAPASLPAPPRARREVYLVDKPGAPQSQIRIGLMGVNRATPDYFPLLVMNTILGGSFSSRLNMNLREEHGYTYGASSSFDMRIKHGPFTAGAGVQTDKTSESLTEFFKELNAIQQPMPGEELTRSKNYVSLRYPGGFETTGDIARRLEDAFVYSLPDDYFSNYVNKVGAVAAADVERVAREYLSPGTAAVVIVGDRQAIEPGIKALNLGPINYLSIEDVFQ